MHIFLGFMCRSESVLDHLAIFNISMKGFTTELFMVFFP